MILITVVYFAIVFVTGICGCVYSFLKNRSSVYKYTLLVSYSVLMFLFNIGVIIPRGDSSDNLHEIYKDWSDGKIIMMDFIGILCCVLIIVFIERHRRK